MLIRAAAAEWQVEPATCGTEPGHVVHAASGKRLSYGKLAEKAADLKPPENVRLKDPKDFRLVGKPTRRLDTPDKVSGKAVFGLDVQLPGMLVALVARPPVFGAKVKGFDATKAKAVPGVRAVVAVTSGVAVGVGITPMTVTLCIGSIEKKLALVDGQAIEREVIHLILSVDHEIIDGAPLARFAERLNKILLDGRALTACAV